MITDMLTRDDAYNIDRALDTLRVLHDRCWLNAEKDAARAMMLGRLAEATSVAGDVLFNVLNVACNVTDSHNAAVMIAERSARREEMLRHD